MTRKELESEKLQVIGRRWFERGNSNTYHSCSVFLNNQLLGGVHFNYGYGDSYQQTGFEVIQEALNNPFKDYSDFIAYYHKDPSRVLFHVSDVGRKKDL